METQFSGGGAGGSLSGGNSGRETLDQMADNPRRGSHRRAHSEIAFRLPDDFLFDVDAELPFLDVPSLSEDNNSGDGLQFLALMDTEKSPEPTSVVKEEVGSGGGGGATHLRSLSMDAAFLDGLGFKAGAAENGAPTAPMPEAGWRPQHRRAGSVDGFPGPSSFPVAVESVADVKKAMPADKLAELSLIDPRRAKRILANRQSAARSKERKIRYTSELERKVQTLQTEATTLSAQLTLLQRDTNGLTVENKELKLRLQAMEQQAHLRDALNEALREEVQRLKIATGQVPPMNGNSFSRGMPQANAPFFRQNLQLHHLGRAHVQHPHLCPPMSSGEPLADQSQQKSVDFTGGSGNN
ncbi:transcription factor RF2b-like [Nymphaea colorata]|nr:transcription factor RF2b-like [Nymphaea colorata]